jgi:FAD/FMN-containing dehydrogenase
VERFHRRELLERAALAAVVVPLLRTPLARAAPARDPRVLELDRLLQGDVVGRGESGYGRAKRLYDTRFDAISPLAIAYCETVRDVERAVRWARRRRIRITARSGGHSFAGYSLSPGVVLDVSRMHGVAVDGARKTAAIGAGRRLIDVYAQLWAKGVAIPAGSCPTVGIAGLALGGGVGFSSRRLGTTSDSIREVRLVTAAGDLVVANPQQHSDLYWACRGGGGGNFGVVTSFRFAVHPVANVSTYVIEWPWDQARAAIAAWQGFAPHAPDALFSVCDLIATAQEGPTVKPHVASSGQFFGSPDDLRSLMKPLVDGPGLAPSRVQVVERTYFDAALEWAGCRTLDACHAPGRVTARRRSDFVAKPLSAAGIDGLVRWTEQRQADPGLGFGEILLDPYGGAINRVAPGATAFVHRRELFSIQYAVLWNPSDSPSVVAANRRSLNEVYDAMRPHVSGYAYQNYIDPDLQGWAHAYYGANYPRLRKVKRRYDPGNVFHFAQSIRP